MEPSAVTTSIAPPRPTTKDDFQVTVRCKVGVAVGDAGKVIVLTVFLLYAPMARTVVELSAASVRGVRAEGEAIIGTIGINESECHSLS
jgi:hypothetical protein